jgi:hypothetical protein
MDIRGSAILPLHRGRAPRWLFKRMVELSACIVTVIVQEYGLKGFLERISDPWFFQSLSCILGYDWHSSGTTTVTCGALKEAMGQCNIGLTVAGGKGKTSRKAPLEIREKGTLFGLNSKKIEELVYASKMTAKVDNSLIQDGYSLYHHTFFFDEKGDWVVIQQGLNKKLGNARRYHWPSEFNDFILEPETTIFCQSKIDRVLNMAHRDSEDNQKTCVDLVRDNPRKFRKLIIKPLENNQRRLDGWLDLSEKRTLVMPNTINWDALRRAYEFQPDNYEELIALKGIGPSTVRGLSLVAELIYGEGASWRDPVRFNFAFGGKDGVPFPVDRKAMDSSIEILRKGILSSRVNENVKKRSIEKLRSFVPNIQDLKRNLF